MMNIRPSAIAGRWYPGQPEALIWELDQYLEQAQGKPPGGKIWGLVVPHAGYYYSGLVAAYAFKCLEGLRPEIVAIVSPLHSDHAAPLLTTAYEAYQTPLGMVEVDTQAIADLDRALQEEFGEGLTPLQQDREHALEIELPFLQRVLDQFCLLPVMIRDQRTAVAQALGQALAVTLKGRPALLVASSDLSHFYPQPLAHHLDTELLRRLAAFDPQGIMEAELEGVGFACGDAAIAAVLWAARELGANRVNILRQATSGEVTGDLNSVVGYGSAVIWQEAEEKGGSKRRKGLWIR
jgi:AmmeMemoRadiSam system protein B